MDSGTDAGRPVRAVSVALSALGVVHLLAPRVLLGVARGLYRLLLDIRFEPTARSPRRVRVVGICMIATAAVLARLSGDDSGHQSP